MRRALSRRLPAASRRWIVSGDRPIAEVSPRTATPRASGGVDDTPVTHVRRTPREAIRQAQEQGLRRAAFHRVAERRGALQRRNSARTPPQTQRPSNSLSSAFSRSDVRARNDVVLADALLPTPHIPLLSRSKSTTVSRIGFAASAKAIRMSRPCSIRPLRNGGASSSGSPGRNFEALRTMRWSGSQWM